MNLWKTMLRDSSYADVSEAVTDFIASDTKGFPPPIGAIKERVKEKERAMPVFFSVDEDWKRLLEANQEGLAICGRVVEAEGEKEKKPALWASEIEEFPIAVTKKHFPE